MSEKLGFIGSKSYEVFFALTSSYNGEAFTSSTTEKIRQNTISFLISKYSGKNIEVECTSESLMFSVTLKPSATPAKLIQELKKHLTISLRDSGQDEIKRGVDGKSIWHNGYFCSTPTKNSKAEALKEFERLKNPSDKSKHFSNLGKSKATKPND